MKYKWHIFWAIIVLYTIGIIGMAWHTYGATKVLQATQPTFIPSVETAKIVFIMIGGLGVILPTYLNIYTALHTQKTTEDRIRFDRVENTYQLLERWDAPSLLEARRYTRELKAKQKDLSTNQLIAEIEANANLKQSLILVLNYFEAMRVSIQHERVDTKIIADSFYHAFDDIFERFKPYISEKMNAKVYSDLVDLKKLLDKHNA